jgi:hypothetical protein
MISPAVVLTGVVLLLGTAVTASAQAEAQLVLAKTGTKEYHWPHCPEVRDGKDVLALTRGQAHARGLTPHKGCDPSNPESVKPGDPAPEVRTDPKGPVKSKVPTYVFVEKAGGRHYHLDTCKTLGKERTKLLLDVAGRKYWPCPACKPPIRPRPKRERRSHRGSSG